MIVEARDFEAAYQQYIYLIRYLAARYCSPVSPDFEDFVQEGLIALWQTLRNFDPDLSIKSVDNVLHRAKAKFRCGVPVKAEERMA